LKLKDKRVGAFGALISNIVESMAIFVSPTWNCIDKSSPIAVLFLRSGDFPPGAVATIDQERDVDGRTAQDRNQAGATAGAGSRPSQGKIQARF
jgi:hypothetical protein